MKWKCNEKIGVRKMIVAMEDHARKLERLGTSTRVKTQGRMGEGGGFSKRSEKKIEEQEGVRGQAG